MHFIKKPNLPAKKVSKVIIGEEYAPILSPLLQLYGVSVLACPRNLMLDKRLGSHVDLSVLHLGGKRLYVSNAVASPSFISDLSELGAEIELRAEPCKSTYPEDAKLCACLIGGMIYHNSGATVFNSAPGFVNVKQGYAKCAACVVTDNATITSDRGIAKGMLAQGLDVLKISPGNIDLDGFETGFIGGSTFKLSEDILALTGSLDSHPDKAKIESFLRSHGVEPVYLCDRKIFDMGSAIPLIESD